MQLTPADRALAAGIAGAFPLEVSFSREGRRFEVSVTTREGDSFGVTDSFDSPEAAYREGRAMANDPVARVSVREL
jgi:hypothetical protein